MLSPNEHAVLKLSDLPPGQMKQVEIGDAKIVLANVAGKIHALAGTCPHYGAPLAEGTLCGSRLRCPWHQGCFDVTSGDLLEPPPLVGLRRYDVRVEGDQIFVSVPTEAEPIREPASVGGADPADRRNFVIAGAGAAGECAAQTLREAGYRGRIQLLSPELDLPYDRPALSKNYLAGQPLDHPLALQPPDFYSRLAIERVAGRVTSISPGDHTITFDDGRAALSYEALLIASGSVPRRLDVPGAELPNIFTLRSLRDCDRILSAVKPGGRAVLIGTGFIGMEAASALAQRGMRVTIVGRDAAPFKRVLGEPIGRMLQQIHEKNGVTFRLNAQVARFEGDSAAVRRVVLQSGEALDADFVILALGVRPNTDFLRGSIDLNDDGSLSVDSSMLVVGQTNIYAAGDIARFPRPQRGDPIRVEHWRVAQQQGRVAAFNMAGRATTYDEAPYFWSFQHNVGFDYVGHGEGFDRIYVNGDTSPDHPDFLAFYIQLDDVLGVLGCGHSRETNAIAELMRAGRMPSGSEVRTQPVNWLERVADECGEASSR
jgi:NADPH-dependent 2,4-dienoyl-CoA reductase/sulfur reductase-like enzyme/nitrite reductase/ring-hydroxylating ferredoxin subunit